MKVNKDTQVKCNVKSLKWKDVRGIRSRAPIGAADLNSSPVMAHVIKQHQASAKKKPAVKRLKKRAKCVSDSKKGSPLKKTQANGSSTFTMNGDSDDSEEWRGFSQSIQANGVKNTSNLSQGQPRRLEAPSLHGCAERDDKRNHAVVVMQKDETLCFRGKCFLTCLFGRIEVMGFIIEEGQQSYPLYSPASHCPLTITALGSCSSRRDERSLISVILRKYLSPASQKKLLKKVMLNSALVLLEPMETPLTHYLSSFTDLRNLFSPPMTELMSAAVDTPLNGLGVIPLASSIKGLTVSHSGRNALNTLVNACRGDMDGCAVVLVYGTKNVGKSTYIRLLINTLLNHTTGVDYLEADLGQTEFTPAGCLSLLTVREPVLGPPFTHQRTPDHMVYYGESSCEADLDHYLECLKSLWRRRSQNRETPIIINTMGWVKGFGFQLLVDMIRFFPVTHLIQLAHSDTTQCPSLTPEFIRTAQGYQTHPPAPTTPDDLTETHSPPRSYVHIVVQSTFQGVALQGTSKHQRTNEIRELSLLAYLSQLHSSDLGPVRPLHCLTPYQVPITAVAVGMLHCDVVPSHMLYAASGSLVGLGCLGEKVTSKGGPVLLSQNPICPCVGFGVVRGIDVERGLYYLLTPVDPSILRKVNCLLLGAISLPSSILTTQDGFDEDIPFVTTEYSFELTGAGKLRVFKGLLRPSHIGTQ